MFLTTTTFSSDAIDFATRIDSKAILVDGPTLAKYMIDYNVGVSPSQMYDIKRLDLDYIIEE